MRPLWAHIHSSQLSSIQIARSWSCLVILFLHPPLLFPLLSSLFSPLYSLPSILSPLFSPPYSLLFSFPYILVNRTLLRLPRFRVWMWWFGFALLLSMLSSLPFYVAVASPNKNIQVRPFLLCLLLLPLSYSFMHLN